MLGWHYILLHGEVSNPNFGFMFSSIFLICWLCPLCHHNLFIYLNALNYSAIIGPYVAYNFQDVLACKCSLFCWPVVLGSFGSLKLMYKHDEFQYERSRQRNSETISSDFFSLPFSKGSKINSLNWVFLKYFPMKFIVFWWGVSSPAFWSLSALRHLEFEIETNL